ncbi:MAG: CPBP family intramembrane glutamic endopeptidase [Gaiellales bacterium]
MGVGRLTTTTSGVRTGWFVLAGLLAAVAYASTLFSSSVSDEEKRQLLYKWSSAIGGGVQYLVIAVVVLVLVRRLEPAVLGLEAPRSWRRASAYTAAALVVVFVVGAVLNVFLKAGEEQGLVPERWEPEHAAPFVANFVVVALVAPFVEELTYRGLGFAVLDDMFGRSVAIVGCGLAFGLAHGLFVALPMLTFFGIVLAVLRDRSGSIYPAMILHMLFNGIALVAAVTHGSTV